jgi:rubrerythrin
MKKLVAAAILATVVLVPTALAAVPPAGAKAALADTDLTLADMLTYALQDERIARAEYEAILGAFGDARPFSNIIKAEEAHLRSLTDLFAARTMPVLPDAAPKPAVPKDWASALGAGRDAEIDNIAMYDRFLAQTLPADVRQVFEQLKAASQNHLRAFTNSAGRL